jgi:hypothetical protein
VLPHLLSVLDAVYKRMPWMPWMHGYSPESSDSSSSSSVIGRPTTLSSNTALAQPATIPARTYSSRARVKSGSPSQSAAAGAGSGSACRSSIAAFSSAVANRRMDRMGVAVSDFPSSRLIASASDSGVPSWTSRRRGGPVVAEAFCCPAVVVEIGHGRDFHRVGQLNSEKTSAALS